MPKRTVLVSWIGVTDCRHAFGGETGSPAASVVEHVQPQRVLLLWGDGPKTPLARSEEYRAWLRERVASVPKIEVVGIEGSTDHIMDFGWVYSHLERAMQRVPADWSVALNASSGTWVMSAAWIVYAKAVGTHDCTIYHSSREQGVQILELPPGLRISLRKMLAMTDDDPLLDRYIRGELWDRSPSLAHLVGDSRSLNRIKLQAEAAARYPVPVLITGDPGTGKSVLAKSIHELSKRTGEFVTFDCGQLYSDTEIHSVFGWEKHAFTGANTANPGLVSQAAKGTIFLDEIGNAPPIVQTRLLRFLQTKKYRPLGAAKEKSSDARIVAATNADLNRAVREGTFRQDLLDRLRTVHIDLPSLAERSADVLALANSKLRDFQEKHKDTMCMVRSKPKRFDASAQKSLLAHDWPGNVRELEQLIARLVIFGSPDVEEITGADIQRHILAGQHRRGDSVLGRTLDDGFDLEALTREVQWHYVREAAQKSGGNRAEMARLLGYGESRTPLKTILKNFTKYGLTDPITGDPP